MNEHLMAPNSITERIRLQEPVRPEEAWIPREVVERLKFLRAQPGPRSLGREEPQQERPLRKLQSAG